LGEAHSDPFYFLVIELAERVGQSLDATSKNMAVLRNAIAPNSSPTKPSAFWTLDTACCG
jgi:hypothetical protein